jgi:4-amino-4-deoxy-L-arabinose transferase-like glycosyltransferase
MHVRRTLSDRTIVLALFALGILTRLFFQSQILYHWDSVNLALATQRFDISPQFEQPQPPGYIVYVGLGKLFNVLSHDPQLSYVWISIAASGLAVALCFLVGKEMFGLSTGLIAGLIVLTSPLVWFYGEIALPHVLDMALVLAVVFFLYKAYMQQSFYLMLAAATLIVAGGVRPQTLLFLAPLYLLVAWKAGFKIAAQATALLAVGSLIWLVPLMWLSGGVDRYRQILAEFSLRFDSSTSVFLGAGWNGLLQNINKLIEYTSYGLGLAALPLFIYAALRMRHASTSLRAARIIFLGAWILPALGFYTLIHMGQQGLVFVYLPALLIVGAYALVQLAHSPRVGATLAYSFLALVLLVNGWLFLFAPEHLLPDDQLKILNWSTIKNLDAHFLNFFQQVRANYSPSDTLILTSNWRHVEYYLPEYRVLHAPVEDSDAEYRFVIPSAIIPMTQLNLILFDSPVSAVSGVDLHPVNVNPSQLVSLALHQGDVIVYANRQILVEKHGQP